MKKNIFFAILFVLPIFFVSCKTYVDTSKIEYPSPNYSSQQKIELDNFNNSIKQNPGDADAYFNRANLKRTCGDFKGAFEDYSKAIKLDDTNYRYYYERAMFEKNYLGRLVEAVKDLNRVTELVPDYDNAYKERADIKIKIADFEGAVKDCSKAIELNPYNDLVYRKRAEAKSNLDDRNGALEDYTKAIMLAPSNYESYNGKANSIDIREDYEQAIDCYKKITELMPNRADVWDNYGNALRNFGKSDEAIKAYNKATELNSSHINAYANLARTQRDMQDYKNSLKNFKKALTLNVYDKDIKHNIKDLEKKINNK